MRIRYEEPVNETNMSLLATIAIIIFGGIIAVNFSSISDSAAETTVTITMAVIAYKIVKRKMGKADARR